MLSRSISLLALPFIVSLAPAALAQGEPAEEGAAEGGEGEAAAGEGEAADAEKTEEAPKEEGAKTPPVEPPADEGAGADSPVEERGTTYRFVGLRYRGVIVPKFMMNLFGDGGSTVYVDAFGPEFTIRKDAFEYVFSLWFADYGMEDTPFKASSDENDAWEIVNSEVKVIYLTSDFLWSHEFSPQFALNYGMGAGFGIVFGDLSRVQAHPGTGDPDDPESYSKCRAPGDPPGGTPVFCGTDNDHYDDYTEPSWANGGSKPIIFPWLAIQTGLRYKPHRNFMARLDLGFGTSGFFLGLAANYGL
jgi:hypothetical protein